MGANRIVVLNLVLYGLFVLAGICLFLAFLILVGWGVVWHGLAFPLDFSVILRLTIGAGILVALGLGAYWAAKRYW